MNHAGARSLLETAALCRANAEFLLRLGRRTHPQISFDLVGAAWLDRYIRDTQLNLAEDLVDEFIELAGCFFGECLIETLDGRWAESDDMLGVAFDDGRGTIPFVAVAMQVRGEPDASVAEAFVGAVSLFSKTELAA